MRFDAMLGLILALGLAGFAIGCGSQEHTAAPLGAGGTTVKEQMKQEHIDLRAERKAARAGNTKKGRDRAP
jgi:hypothetical protein